MAREGGIPKQGSVGGEGCGHVYLSVEQRDRRRLQFDGDEFWFCHDEQGVRSPALGFTADTNMMFAVNRAALKYMLAVKVAIGIAKVHYVNELDK